MLASAAIASSGSEPNGLIWRLSHNLLVPDALIAATTIVTNQPLISKNQKDFRFIAGLKLLPYP